MAADQPKGSLLIVDGHSIIHAWDDLLAMHRGPERRKARTELTSRLQTYQDSTGDQVLVVFDGKGDRASKEREPEGVQVVYSDSSRTADDIIERIVARHGKEYDIRVATADGMERTTVSAFGGWPIGPDELQDLVDRAEKDLSDRIRRLNNS